MRRASSCSPSASTQWPHARARRRASIHVRFASSAPTAVGVTYSSTAYDRKPLEGAMSPSGATLAVGLGSAFGLCSPSASGTTTPQPTMEEANTSAPLSDAPQGLLRHLSALSVVRGGKLRSMEGENDNLPSPITSRPPSPQGESSSDPPEEQGSALRHLSALSVNRAGRVGGSVPPPSRRKVHSLLSSPPSSPPSTKSVQPSPSSDSQPTTSSKLPLDPSPSTQWLPQLSYTDHSEPEPSETPSVSDGNAVRSPLHLPPPASDSGLDPLWAFSHGGKLSPPAQPSGSRSPSPLGLTPPASSTQLGDTDPLSAFSHGGKLSPRSSHAAPCTPSPQFEPGSDPLSMFSQGGRLSSSSSSSSSSLLSKSSPWVSHTPGSPGPKEEDPLAYFSQGGKLSSSPRGSKTSSPPLPAPSLPVPSQGVDDPLSAFSRAGKLANSRRSSSPPATSSPARPLFLSTPAASPSQPNPHRSQVQPSTGPTHVDQAGRHYSIPPPSRERVHSLLSSSSSLEILTPSSSSSSLHGVQTFGSLSRAPRASVRASSRSSSPNMEDDALPHKAPVLIAATSAGPSSPPKFRAFGKLGLGVIGAPQPDIEGVRSSLVRTHSKPYRATWDTTTPSDQPNTCPDHTPPLSPQRRTYPRLYRNLTRVRSSPSSSRKITPPAPLSPTYGSVGSVPMSTTSSASSNGAAPASVPGSPSGASGSLTPTPRTSRPTSPQSMRHDSYSVEVAHLAA